MKTNQDKIDALKDEISELRSRVELIKQNKETMADSYEAEIKELEKDNMDLRFKLKMLLKLDEK